MDWEEWLRNAKEPPSVNEDSKRERTENQIREALKSYEPLQGRPYRVYTKGSYANNTNVRLNYDVDIAVEYFGYFYSDMMFDLKDRPKSDVGVVSSDDPYTRAEFKADILAALEQAYGKSAITSGRIAYRVREKKTTLPADVVPSWEYRRYDRITNGVPVFFEGSRVFPSDGGYKDNYPKIQVTEGTTKNNATNYRYKWMVRSLKRLQTKLVADGLLDAELPSYLIECLVYNVPNDGFGHSTYMADMRSVLASIFNATLVNGDSDEWLEVHRLRYLFRGSPGWTTAEVHHVAQIAWDTLGFE
jgi:predicted nucleotidyltransferase